MIRIQINQDLALKQIEHDDAIAIFQTIDTQRGYLGKWLPFVDITHTIEDSVNFIRSIYSNGIAMAELVFVIHFQGEFAGLIGFKETDLQNNKTEIGYWLSKHYQKKGIMTRCVKRLVKFAFDELNLNRIQIKCATENASSNDIPLRLNFKLEGVERDGELLSDGKYTDLKIYSLIKKDVTD